MTNTRNLIRALLWAALAGALLTSAFHLTVTERLIDRAIALEEQAQERQIAQSGAADERPEPVLSRRAQKLGLLLSVAGYGLAAGAIFAGVFGLLSPRLTLTDVRAKVALIGAGAVVSVIVIPYLKFPANPPGVGDPATLARRQLLYIGLVLLSLAGLWIAVRLYRGVRRTRGVVGAALSAAVVYGLWTVALLLALPGRTDPVNTPTGLLWQFRAASLGGVLLFWLTFLVVFAWSLANARAVPRSTFHVPG